ncbi:MAG: NAD(+)/NADH kinase [Armatimonadetes bacterium]|nr:NAD(+)/NADH kinase [Armatimonadota bacterium]
MRTVGLAPNPNKKEAVQLAAELADWLSRRGVKPLLVREVATAVGKHSTAADDDEIAKTDMLLVLGGDGTMLRWNRLAAHRGTPMLGVNFGQYGFITEIHPKEAVTALQRVLDGDYVISERVVLRATVHRHGEETGKYFALNDAVVSKGPVTRMLGLRTFVDGRFIVTYSADGIIVSTPTGSTAYSLSAGGPVVHPNVSVLVITPICPHTMNARSLVIPDTETVKVCAESSEHEVEIALTMDGQVMHCLTMEDSVEIAKADFRARLIQLDPQSFYDKLQNRLRWGERFSGEQL